MGDAPTLSPFGERLRAWRRRRGLSQLDLAIEADTTPRYVSFIETGRSRPGREVVMRLGEALGLSLRDRNALLLAAGLSPVFTEHALGDEPLRPIRDIISRVLDNHNPFPAFAFAPALRLLQANRTAERLFPGMTTLQPSELVELWCTPNDAVPRQDTCRDAHLLVAMLRRELVAHPHPDLPALLEQAERLAKQLGPPPDLLAEQHDSAVLCGRLHLDGRELKTVATVLRFDKPIDVTVAELRVELIFPADAETDAFFRSIGS